MTREEALNILHNASVYHPDYLDALNMAIKVLEQESCEDVVSRRAAIEIARSNIHYGLDKEYEYSRELLEKTMAEISSLPSVRPQEPKIVPIAEIKFSKDELKELVDKAVLTVTSQEPKTGHWIMLGGKEEIYCEEAKCSICGSVEVNAGYDKYCPNCGAKMESRDKE